MAAGKLWRDPLVYGPFISSGILAIICLGLIIVVVPAMRDVPPPVEDIDYEAIGPPEGLEEAGIPLGDTSGERITVVTDVQCPHCSRLFEERIDDIGALIDSPDWAVHLEPVSIFEDSAYSEFAALTLLHHHRSGGQDILGLYLAFEAVSELAGSEDRAEIEQLLDEQGYGHVDVIDPENADERLTQWLEATSARVQDGPGAVPALRVDDDYEDPSTLSDLAALESQR
ncbi:thioredoxin domain-containing protein [Nesterenkonia haasae]|uniref:hypothetical protein n=1 Tax=Nesterenkonia haasae TaxID=2587813 RepID=UPI001391DC3F|nr:hypothetical protein [Nesterenkonia haasae]NDK32460.1 hypothetical protein [Nesterenkonia haasae]